MHFMDTVESDMKNSVVKPSTHQEKATNKKLSDMTLEKEESVIDSLLINFGEKLPASNEKLGQEFKKRMKSILDA